MAALLISVIGLGILRDFNFNYIYLVYFIGMIYLLSFQVVKLEVLLKITNRIYSLYVLLSFLLYLDIINLNGRELNNFHYNIFGYNFETFIGYYGSTASIDSISLFVALLNLLFNKGKSRWLIVVITVIISIGTLRETPFVALILSLFFIQCIKYIGKFIKYFIPMFIFIAFFIPYSIIQISNSASIIKEFFVTITSARTPIWNQMLDIYINSNVYGKLFGFGNTELFKITPFGKYDIISGYQMIEVINPHNNYFTILIQYGLFVFFGFLIFIIYKLRKIDDFKFLLIIFYILIIAITNNQIFTFHFPIYLIWLILLLNNNIIIKNKG
ncbi:O-antigen ligase family protein [Gracilibacillus halophilus]|nr:O-antigen ligase family protein [Gracilibacillus halophilus]